MKKKQTNLSKKVAAVVAGSLALMGLTTANNVDVTSNITQDDSKTEIVTNKVLKPQLVIKPNFNNPDESLVSMHTSHASHSSHSSHSSHYSHYSGYAG